MGANVWPVDPVAGAPAYPGRALRQTTVAPFVSLPTTSRTLGAKSGVRPGTRASIVTATSTLWTVTPFVGVIDGEAANSAGPYSYAFDTNQTGSVVAAGGSARTDRLDVQVSDPAEGDGTAAPSIQIVYTQGTPALAAAPPRSHPLAQINVPASGGGAPTITWTATYLSGAGGYMLFNTLAEANAFGGQAHVGQHATINLDPTPANNGDYVWTGSIWLQTVYSTTAAVAPPFAQASSSANIAATGVTTVNFPAGRFTVPPIVQATVILATSGVISVAWIGAAPTAASFAARIFTLAGSQIGGTIHWTATQMTPTSAAG